MLIVLKHGNKTIINKKVDELYEVFKTVEEFVIQCVYELDKELNNNKVVYGMYDVNGKYPNKRQEPIYYTQFETRVEFQHSGSIIKRIVEINKNIMFSTLYLKDLNNIIRNLNDFYEDRKIKFTINFE